MNQDEIYMEKCLELAFAGRYSVAPNPMVGCVIVKGNVIIGEGFHQKYGEAHAEVNAIKNVKDHEDLKEATLYVNLEPCSHYGKTPPCADLIVEKQLKRVVIAGLDSNPAVAGKGVAKLEAAGIEVKVGVLEDEARFLNRRFFTFQEKKRPYILLKWAQSSDGFMDKIRKQDTIGVNWITHKDTKRITHSWRAEEMAILVGRRTVANDNPSLTTRAFFGSNPTRIVLDPRNILSEEIPKDYNIYSEEAETLIYNWYLDKEEGSNVYIKISKEGDPLQEILHDLYKRQTLSLIIEGGKRTLEAFLEAGLWDEARVITGKVEFSEGLEAPLLEAELADSESVNGDIIDYFYQL